MIFIRAFIFATAWAYLICAIYASIGKPPLVDIDTRLQTAFYLCAFGVFIYISYNLGTWIMNLILGIFYSFGAMGSFIGYPQKWAAYWKSKPEEGSDAGQVGMALWDLALAVAFLSLV